MIDKLTVTDGALPFASDRTELNQKVLEAKNINLIFIQKIAIKDFEMRLKLQKNY